MSVHLVNDMDFLDGIKEEDVDYVKEQAVAGDANAQYHLGLMFDTGRGVARNPREASKWYQKAAEKGHRDASYYLARMYSLETSGISKNETEAMKWLKKAADLGHIEAVRKVSN